MSPVGPQLPPHLQKRKRGDDENGTDSHSDSDSSTGPLPPQKEGKEQSPPSAKRSRVLGPTLPPAPLDERPPSGPLQPTYKDEESSDSDDDFGPALPSARDAATKSTTTGPRTTGSTVPAAPAKRDEWMTLAPQGGDWSQRVDPTKLKSRKFNTGRGAKGPSQAGGGGESWHETPEEKLARLRREAMGIKDNSAPGKTTTVEESDPNDEATRRRLKEYNVSSCSCPVAVFCCQTSLLLFSVRAPKVV